MSDAGTMLLMGLTTSVGAPAMVVSVRRREPWRRIRVPAALAAGMFVPLHAVVTIAMSAGVGGPKAVTGWWLLLATGAAMFWWPVLSPRSQLSWAGRSAYLFLVPMSLDAAAIYPISTGDRAGGIAMILGMLPLGLAAMAVTWRWMRLEERLVAGGRSRADADEHIDPVPPWRPPALPGLVGERAPVRLLRIGLGVLWLVDGTLQFQPDMPSRFVSGVLTPAWAGQPWPLSGLGVAAKALWSAHPLLADTGAALIQLAIGAMLLSGRRQAVRLALVASILWGTTVWVLGEAFGRVFVAGASVLSGAPGAAVLYVIVAILLLTGAPARVEFGRRSAEVLGGGWMLAAAAQALPRFWSGAALHDLFATSAAASQPAMLKSPQQILASLAGSDPMAVNAALVAAMAVLGIGLVVAPPRAVRGWLLASGVVLGVLWWVGTDFGMLGGVGTDPQTAAPAALLVGAAWMATGRECPALPQASTQAVVADAA
ncbi:MAG: hypothetical protein J2P57_02135 [Acidimicrobiaceae bacterium]|nr:hypothetical protein [Acidimicrobiaceae bacterium]